MDSFFFFHFAAPVHTLSHVNTEHFKVEFSFCFWCSNLRGLKSIINGLEYCISVCIELVLHYVCILTDMLS